MKTGLIMEGGAMRGMFTAGVTDVMMENNICFDGAIGVSAGAVFGCNYKSNQPGRVIRYNVKYCKDPRYAGLRSLIKTGDLYGEQFCYHDIPERLDVFDKDTFMNSPMEFYAVCTDVETGASVYHKCNSGDAEDLQWLRASASMPLVSRVVKAGGYSLLDGGISDSVPLRYFESIGYNHNIVILTQPDSYIKEKNKYLPLIRLTMKKYPNMIEAMKHRHEKYNETIEYVREREKSGDILVIRPESELGIGKMERNPKKLIEIYNTGRNTALKRLNEIKDFIAYQII